MCISMYMHMNIRRQFSAQLSLFFMILLALSQSFPFSFSYICVNFSLIYLFIIFKEQNSGFPAVQANFPCLHLKLIILSHICTCRMKTKINCRIQTHNRKKYNGVKEIYTRITVLIPIEADIKGDLILLWYEFLNDFTRLEGAILRFSGQSSQTHNCEGRK